MLIQYLCKKQLKNIAYGLYYVWLVELDYFYNSDFDNCISNSIWIVPGTLKDE